MIALQRVLRTPQLFCRKQKMVLLPLTARLFSSVDDQEVTPLVNTEINHENRIATLTLDRPPVNSLSLEMCTAISSAIKEVEANKKVQSLILTSSNTSTLCAGLDLTELYKPDPQRLPIFWTSFQQVFLDLYGSRLAVIGAVGGNAPAAGCMLAMSCDYRIMAEGSCSSRPPPLIGLNEARFGIAAPPWLASLMLRTIGFRQGELALSLGTLFTPEQALDIGLVDQLVPREEVMGASKAVALSWTQIPPHARVASKMLARKEHVDHLLKTREEDVQHFCNFITNDKVQANLGAYLASLKKK